MESLKNPSSTPMHPKKRWRKVEDPADAATPPTKPRLSVNNHQRPPPTVEKTPDEMVEEKYGYLFRSNRESRVKQFQVNAPELHFETAPFETLRPFYDTNLVAPDVRALLQGMLYKIIRRIDVYFQSKIRSRFRKCCRKSIG
jgi:hypothetical protein